MSQGRVLAIDRIVLSVGALAPTQRFYAGALGFEVVGAERWEGAGFAGLLGLPRARADSVVMRLGGQTLELSCVRPAGRAYPRPRAANDAWFQHIAIAVGDMAAAFARLKRSAPELITQGGPQVLPPSAGSVTAVKFRDPDGAPLELSHAPDSAWTQAATQAGASLLGVDHSALAVSDLPASMAFYTELLGLEPTARSLIQGPEQDRLDGLDGVAVDIVALRPAERGPHLELLHYRTPQTRAGRGGRRPDDVGATRLVLSVDDLAAVAARLQVGGATVVSTGIVALHGARRLLVRDPDGHLLELVEAAADKAGETAHVA